MNAVFTMQAFFMASVWCSAVHGCMPPFFHCHAITAMLFFLKDKKSLQLTEVNEQNKDELE